MIRASCGFERFRSLARDREGLFEWNGHARETVGERFAFDEREIAGDAVKPLPNYYDVQGGTLDSYRDTWRADEGTVYR